MPPPRPLDRDPADERGRRIVSVVHIAMMSAIPLYAGVVWFLSPAAPPSTAAEQRLPWVLLAVGAGEFVAATWLGGLLLRASAGRPGGSQRIRRYFLVRFAAAEAIALFGLLVGLRGTPLSHAAVLFGASALALAAAAPTRSAWGRATDATRGTA